MQCGVGDYLARFAASMADRGVEVHIVTSKAAAVTAPDVALRHLPAGRRAAARRRITVWREVGEWTVAGVRPALERVAALAPDLVHLQYPTLVYEQRLGINWLPVRLRLRLPRTPIVTTFHEFTQYGLPGRLRVAANVLLSRRVFVTSDVERAAVGRLYPVSRSNLRVVPVGSAIAVTGRRSAGTGFLRRLGIRPGDRPIVYFGFAGPRKGLPVLYDAIRNLWDRGVPVKLVMACARLRHPLHAQLARQARDLEIMDLVKWTGFLKDEDVSDVLMAAEVCAMPFEDGVKLNRSSLVAVLNHGTPVVTTRGPAIGSLRGADVTFCDPEGGSIADAIHAVLRRPASRRNRPHRPAPAARQFGWDRIADAYLRGYREALARH